MSIQIITMLIFFCVTIALAIYFQRKLGSQQSELSNIEQRLKGVETSISTPINEYDVEEIDALFQDTGCDNGVCRLTPISLSEDDEKTLDEIANAEMSELQEKKKKSNN